MADKKDLERWLTETASSEEMQRMMSEAESGAEPDDDLLARYRAGMLSPEEAERVGNVSVLQTETHHRLVDLDEDIETAAARSEPVPISPFARLMTRASTFLASLAAPRSAVAFASGAAMLAVVLLGVDQLGNRPPGFPSEAFVTQLDGTSKGVAVLPDRSSVGLVDQGWALIEPTAAQADMDWFVWTPVEGVSTYRLRLYSPAGEVLFSRSGLTEPRTELPKEERGVLLQGQTYTWLVEALDAAGAVVLRNTATFELR